MTASFSFGRRDNGQGSVAGVGTTQSGAAALVNGMNLVTTAGGQTAFVLPAKHAVGSPIIVNNASATTALVYPPSGGAINNGSADASFSVAQNKPTIFFAHENGIDYTAVLSA